MSRRLFVQVLVIVMVVAFSFTLGGVVLGTVSYSPNPDTSTTSILGGPVAGLFPNPNFPAPGTESFQTMADIGIQPNCTGSFYDMFLGGPTSVQIKKTTTLTNGAHTFDTEMLAMSLTGVSTQFGPVDVSLAQTPMSTGKVTELHPSTTTDFPARSFFDVFVEVSIPKLGLTGLTNTQAIVMTNNSITSLPPFGSEFVSGGGPWPLYDYLGTPRACIIYVNHIPEDPSHILLLRQLQIIEQQVCALQNNTTCDP